MNKKFNALLAGAMALTIALSMTACEEKSEKEKAEDALEKASSMTMDEFNELAGDKSSNANSEKNAEKPVEIVESVPEPVEIDPFKYLTVSFKGISPAGYVSLANEGKPETKLTFEADNQKQLRNGDTITVTVKAPNAERDNYKLTATEKQFTVEGLPQYLEKLDDLPKEQFEKINQEVEDWITSNVNDSSFWGTEYNKRYFKDKKFLGYYLLTPKEGKEYTEGNRLLVVYTVDAEVKGEAVTYYTGRIVKDIYVLDDGTWVLDFSHMDNISNIVSNGYKDFDSFFSAKIAKNVDEWQYETTIER